MARGLPRKTPRGVVRKCSGCGGDIPAGLRADAKYCSHKCGWASNMRRRQAMAGPRPCDWCESLFSPDKPSRRFCCHQCSVDATKRRHAISCDQCGASFHPKTYTARFCSASCAAKAKHASGVLRHFPRKLTAKRLDRAFEEIRPKRRYVQRLTVARLDKLLAGA